MKRIFLLVGLFLTLISNAQNVGIGTTNPDASAKLEVKSNISGFLPPRMTYAERNAIVRPATGLIIYCTNCANGEMQFYNGTNWVQLMVSTASVPFVTPTVTTNTIDSISTTTARAGGNISSDGGAPVTARGVVWSTSTNPTIALTTKTNNGTGTGSFISNITGLTPGRTYYIRAYATNSVGTAYGAVRTFTTTAVTVPAVTTNIVDSITTTTARSGGNVTSSGNATITARGVVWSTSTNPTIALTTKTNNGAGTGAFTSSITGLTPGRTYYVRAYATNSLGTAYGAERTFTTTAVTVPVVTTNAVDSITTTTARSGGNVTSSGNATVTARGLVWSTSTNPTIALTTKTNNGTGTGSFISNITGLTPGITYYVRAYATNSVGTAYGIERTFTTTAVTVPIVSTNDVDSITTTTARAGGIIRDGGAPVTARGVVWSTSPNPTIALTTKTNNGTGTGSFTSSITGLTPGRTYYVRAYATNSVGTAYGIERTFTTVALTVPTVTTNAVDSITTTTARSGGNVTSSGNATVTARGVVWSTSTNPTIALTTKTNNGIGTGAFISNITGLTPGTTYYIRAYATNSLGTAYGNQVSFTTSQNPAVDTSISSVTIGTQIWSNKNLSVARYRNGDPIPQVTDPTQWRNLTTGAWCWYNNDSSTYARTYGRLYNWYAVNDPRGLAPQGWRIPTEGDWNQLVKFIDPGADTTCQNCNKSAIAGGAMKSTTGWNSPNTGANNSSGFAGLPGGSREDNGSFVSVGIQGFWWGAVNSVIRNVGYRRLFNSNVSVYKHFDNDQKYGFSVRVVRDTIINTPSIIPTITTNAVDSITTTTARSGGNVTSSGNATITARGVVWSTSPNPTIALTTKTNNGTGTGAFTSNINGLTPGTTYYVRAYATNSVGTAYGNQVSFTTTQTPAVDTSISSVTIGTQIWSKKNLDVARYRNGDPIPNVTDSTQWANLTTGAWCWYNNDSATYAATYGRLYNWYAVNDSRGLVPQGWHVPTDGEWTILTNYLGGEFVAGGKMKSTTGWVSPNTGATNSSGFTGLPMSGRNSFGRFVNTGTGYNGIWWSAGEFDSTNAWFRLLRNYDTFVDRGYSGKSNGFSVRVVRD
jgi:uncharacterized protein (TIGR02145 family)